MTQRVLEHLHDLGVDHEYIEVRNNPAASTWVKEQNGGLEKKPTLDIGGQVLTEPSNAEIDDVLAAAGQR